MKPLVQGKENKESPYRATASEEEPPVSRLGISTSAVTVPWSPKQSTQDSVVETQEDTQVFTQEYTQSTQPTQPTQSFRRSMQLTDDERRDTGESFVSAKEAFGSMNASKENLREDYDDDAMDVDDDKPNMSQSDAQDTMIRHDASSIQENITTIHHDMLQESPRQPRVLSEQYSVSAETHEALDSANNRTNAPEQKSLIATAVDTYTSDSVAHQDDTVVHHQVEDQMDIDDDDVRSPSDASSPVKPLVRKSSLTFASLPAREPLAKKSMGNRVSRTSHVDQSKARSSQFGRFTGGKSLGASQYTHLVDTQDDAMDVDEDRPMLQREESETTKLHNSTSTKSLKERLNMLNQRQEPPKRISQSAMTSQSSQPQTTIASQPPQSSQSSQPTYPHLPSGEPEKSVEDEDDDWISPIRTAAPAPSAARPVLSKSYSAETRPVKSNDALFPKPISVSNPNLSSVPESTTPIGSPTGRKYMDGALSASKTKLYSAIRAAKEKIIGSSATSAQVKLDALAESSMMRPKLQTQSSSDDVFSPKKNEKAGTSIFSHLRSPSKESLKSNKSSRIATMPGSPVKENGRRTRSSSERERQREKDEKEAKQKQRTEDRLKEMREKEQSKAAAHYQKTKVSAKTPVVAPPQANPRSGLATATKTPVQVSQAPPSRPGPMRMNTGPRQQEPEESEDIPPPPPPKSLLPTGTGHKLREPKRLVKATSKDALPKGKPQKIQVNLHGSRYGQAPPPAPKPAPSAASKAPVPVAIKPPLAGTRPTQGLTMKPPPVPAPRVASAAPKPAPRMARPQPPKAAEKPKTAPAPPRADLGAARPVSRMQTVQDANRINVPPVNPAKPAKRPFQPENDESLHRPAKRPSQQAKSMPRTPAHAQFAQGKIPFAESVQPAPPSVHYPNGEDIKLPDIMTDSEDEDSENEFEQPDWVNTPNLRQMLESQQLVDPEHIFGPIAPLNMEQVFPNKERHKRFRDRTSSAYWANDQVTEEERRKEREARERLVREGAWTYNPSPLPGPSKLSNERH